MSPDIYQTKKEIEVLEFELHLVKEEIRKGVLDGDLAEVGVMWGGSAKIIREAIPDRDFYMFDTFTGLPDTIIKGVDPDHYFEGDMVVDFEKVKYMFKDYPRTFIYQGVFPETAKPIEDKKFAFVHLDLDIYQSTRDALIFFYPRMNINGSILIHDYPAHRGVKKAVDELMDGVGTFQVHKWERINQDPMFTSGDRQLIIRRRVPNLKLNMYVEPKPKNYIVYD